MKVKDQLQDTEVAEARKQASAAHYNMDAFDEYDVRPGDNLIAFYKGDVCEATFDLTSRRLHFRGTGDAL